MPEEKKGILEGLVETGGGLGEAILQSGLPASIVQKNPLTVLAEQSTALVAVGGLGLVSTIAVIGIIYVTTKNDSEEDETQMKLAGAVFRG